MVRCVARQELLLAALLVAAAGALTTSRDAERLRERVLQGLGLSRIPDPAKMNISQEEYERMHRVYLQRVSENRGPSSDVAQKFYTIAHKGQLEQSRPGAVTWLYFPLDATLATGADVDQATLRALMSTAGHHSGVKVGAHQVLDSGLGQEARRLLDRRPVDGTAVWVEFDVTDAVRSWAHMNASNLGLELTCEGCALVLRQAPVLNVLTNVLTHGRTRRSSVGTLSARRGGCRKDQRCCRHSMEVVFKELKGFDFIVQPKKFDAGFCKGKCPPTFNPAHHHALIQSLIWKKNRQRAPKLCCAPYKLSDLEVLHRDEEDESKLKVTKWEGMSVIDCKCS